MDTFGERLKHAMAVRGVTVADLTARKVMSRANYYLHIGGTTRPENIRDETIEKVCRFLRISRDWLTKGTGPMDAATSSEPDEVWEDIRGYAQAVGLGSGPEAQEYAETHRLKFRSDSLARKRLNPEKLAVMYGSGDSMLPRIHPGDAILFDTADTTPRDGQLYVIMIDGAGSAEYQVKRCQVIADMVFFTADNPAGDHNWRKPRLMEDRKRPITVIGRVRWIGSWEG